MASQEMNANLDRARVLALQKQEIEAELSNKDKRQNGNRIRYKEYHQWRFQKLQEKQAIERELSELKKWRVANDTGPRRRQVVGMLDEYDLKNALAEPQTLLRHARSTIERLTRIGGRTEADRSLMDSITDYLQRHGVQV